MINIFDRVVQYPNRVKLTLVGGTTDTYDVAKVPGVITKAGTSLSRTTLLAMQGFQACTTTLASNTVTETNANGDVRTTTFSADGLTVTETLTTGGVAITKTTTFNGNIITEVIS